MSCALCIRVSRRAMLTSSKKLYDFVISVERVVNKSPGNLFLMNRPDLHSSFTKITLWRQEQFRKIVYIDADVVALRAPDELFDLDVSFAAAPDIGWPDCFNSGVMVFSPNKGDYYALLALAQRGVSFDGADQGLLNMHFTNFHHLPFAYNCTPSAHYQYVPAYRHFQSSISMVHYIGVDKPWLQGREVSQVASVYEELLGRWWAVYDRHYRDGESRIVQQYMKGETTSQNDGVPPAEPSKSFDEAKPSHVPAEQPLHEVQEDLESSKKPDTELQERKFSAPTTQWDPSQFVKWSLLLSSITDHVRSAPPSGSRPEAANFPHTTYSMSHDANLFKAPASYPQPPKDLLYQVPPTPPAGERPKPIFPWEATAAKPTRVFEEESAPSAPQSGLSPPPATDDATQADEDSSTTPVAGSMSTEPFQTFASTGINAWDNMPEIDQYISNISQYRQGKVQVLQGGPSEDVMSPGGRRASTKVTDFPSEIERPSLPVTPAPVRRPSFWGAERNREGELPAAEGVPRQEDWVRSLVTDGLING